MNVCTLFRYGVRRYEKARLKKWLADFCETFLYSRICILKRNKKYTLSANNRTLSFLTKLNIVPSQYAFVWSVVVTSHNQNFNQTRGVENVNCQIEAGWYMTRNSYTYDLPTTFFPQLSPQFWRKSNQHTYTYLRIYKLSFTLGKKKPGS